MASMIFTLIVPPFSCFGESRRSLTTKHTDFLLNFVSLWMLFQMARCEGIVSIDCEKSGISFCQTMDQVCSGHCSDSCVDGPRSSRSVWGASIYTYDSSVCKSAIHDRRISTWDTEKRNFVLKRTRDYKNYWSSDRFGIRTLSHLQLYNRTHGSFIFENPRIEEEILDVASVHSMFLIPQSSSHVQSCYVATNRKVSFRNDSNPLSKSFVGNTTVLESSLFRYTKTWSVASDNGFLCIPEKTMLSIITSVAMRSDAHFLPTSLTYIANVNDSVTLSMNKKYKEGCTTTWRKDGKVLPSFISNSKIGETSLTLDSAEEGSQGLYSLQCGSEHDRRGIMRLIVRACPKDKYGDKCIAQCPECKNGGVCHDITGVCICPPGFNGTLCQDACPPDYFGQACSMTCESGGTSCQGKLICLPDPYGCSCGSGYKGISCDETCASGEFGVGCSQKRECHCSNGQPCDAHSGLCSSGCQDGWHGDGCAISYPVLTEVPISVNSSKNSLTLSFREWDSKLDKGSGTPLTYTIHFMEKAESGASTEWKSKNVSPSQDALKQQIVVTLDKLKPSTDYAVKVEIIDKSGGSQRGGLKASEFTTLCDKPQEPPTNINLSATEDKVFIGWDMPPKSSWNCKSVEVVVKYNNYSFSTQEVLLDSRHSHEFSSSPFTSWNVIVCLRPEGGVSADGTCSEEQVVRTKEVAPGIVNGFSHRSVSSRSVALEWRQPAETNGVIRYFILRYQQTGWKHACSDLYDDSVEVLNVSSWYHKVTNLNPSSRYLFSLSAFTVKEGPSLNLSIETKTDVPSAAPRHLTLSDGYKSLTWEEPPCSVTNGRIKDYLITMTSLNEWDKMKIKEITNEKQFDLPSTIPYTKYNLTVSASTEAGTANTCAEYDFETESGDPPTPRNFRIYSQNRNSFYLAWLPPHPPHGRLSKYEIRYKIKGSQGWKEVADISPTNCSTDQLKQYHCYTLTNLEQNETFSIQIKAFNEGLHSGSKYSEEITGLTTELIPGPPSSTTAPERNESSITIRWETPVIKNGILLNYRVNMSFAKSYSSLADESSFKNGTEIIPASERQCTFTNLWPATIYNFTIEARTAAGYGPALTTSLTTSIRVPVIDREPEFINKTLNSITIKIFPVTPKGGPISAYFVIVKTLPTRTRTKRYAKDFFTPRNCKVLMDSEQRHIVARIRDVPVTGKVFTVGDGKCREGYYNQPLTSEIYYRIGIAVLSQYDKEEKYSEIKYVSAEEDIFVGQHVETSDTYGTVLGILIFLIVVISVLTFIFFKKPHLFSKAKKKISRTLRLIPATERNLDFSYANATAEYDDFIETESLSEDVNCLILVKDLEDFVLRGSRNGEIKRQHRALPKGQKFACHISKIPENRVKNRYGNLLPYDHTRVILKTITGVPHSDYINANYVSGYKKAKKYIATQGPMPKTVNDFWRMVWKEKSCKILMATNLIEGGRVKCDKYWPDDTDTFGSITVTLKNFQPLADYVIRTYEISQGKEKRELKHFHFLTWPDHGVPMYASPVVKFLKKTRDYKPESKTPVIVHCSAGVGRTGTLILLDSMMEMGAAEGRVDVCGHLSVMRRERNNIVENLEQFVFVYKALVQYLCWDETVVLCSDLIPQIGKLRTPDSVTYFTPLEMQYQRLSKICPHLDNAAVRIARDPANVPKNRSMRILPPERARPFIKPRPGEEGIPYINAVYVNGYKERDAFLVTQFPLPCTITDFWQMIRDTKSQTIVLLQDIDFTNPTCPRYWPCEGETMVYGEFQVQCSLKELYGGFYIWRLSLCTLNSDDDSAVPVALFHHLSWAANQSLPQHPNSILNLIEAVENAQKQCGKHIITVQCLDGSTACGLFCAAEFMLSKMINDQEVDAFLAVQNIRVNRPQFIESFEQYDFLYSLAVSFLDNFGTYANFL